MFAPCGRAARSLILALTVAPRLARAQESAAGTAMLGCYRLLADTVDVPAVARPSVFRLDAERPTERLPLLRRIDAALRRADSESAPGVPPRPPFDTATAFGPWRRALPDPWMPMHMPRTMLSTAWRIVGVDSLQLVWSDGYSNMRLDLRVGADTLRGKLELASDQVGHERTGSAKAWRVACPTDLARPAPGG